MTLNLLAGAGRRRAVDRVAELREENSLLLNRQAAADDYFTRLMDDLSQMYTAWRHSEWKAECAEGLALARQVELCELRTERDQLVDEVRALRSQLAPYLAAEANAQSVTVPPMVRDTTAIEDQATGPIDVRPLWQALDIGPVAATDPAHIPSWADTEELPVVELAKKEAA
jgi:hypothetical protein